MVVKLFDSLFWISPAILLGGCSVSRVVMFEEIVDDSILELIALDCTVSTSPGMNASGVYGHVASVTSNRSDLLVLVFFRFAEATSSKVLLCDDMRLTLGGENVCFLVNIPKVLLETFLGIRS